jgi:hypothetical protein
LLDGAETDAGVWAEALEQQAAARARRAFGAGELEIRLREQREALVRLGPTCFLFGDVAPLRWSPLAERIRAQLDPAGTLA